MSLAFLLSFRNILPTYLQLVGELFATSKEIWTLETSLSSSVVKVEQGRYRWNRELTGYLINLFLNSHLSKFSTDMDNPTFDALFHKNGWHKVGNTDSFQ